MPTHRALYLALPDAVADALVNLALSEYRRPRDQATKLLIESLRRANALPAESPDLTEANDLAAVAATK